MEYNSLNGTEVTVVENNELDTIQEAEVQVFNETQTIGDVSIDMDHQLFKVKNATSELKKKGGFLAKTGRVTAAMMTAGASLAAEAAIKYAMKPDDKIFEFNKLMSYEVLQDDEQVTTGGLGAAAAGGLLLGPGGALLGGIVGKRKTKKAVDTLVLKINLDDIDFPCVMISYLNKSTKVKSNKYKKAVSDLEKTKSSLDIIFKRLEEQEKEKEKEEAAEANSLDELIKYKKLLDMGIIDEAEFEAKKNAILG